MGRRQLTALFLTLAMLLSQLPVTGWGVETDTPQEITQQAETPSEQMEEILTVETMVVDESQQEQVAEKLFQQVGETSLEEAPPEAPVWHTQLDDLAQALGDAMERREEQFTLGYCGDEALIQAGGGTNAVSHLFNDDLLPIAYAHTGEPTRGDYLKWHYASGLRVIMEIQQDTESGLYYHTFHIATTYYTTVQQEQEVDDKVAEVCKAIYMEGMSDYEKVRAAYDYVTSHVTYTPDYESKDAQGDLLHYSAYSALIRGNAVCQGYSLLLYRLLLEAGIDNRIISGANSAGRSHSWNIVCVDGLYYNVDATWDAGKAKYGCLLKCDKTFTGHTRDDGTGPYGARYDYASDSFYAAYPMGTEDYYPLSAPQVTGILSHSGGMTVSWSPVEGAAWYQILERSGSNWKTLLSTQSCSATLTDLAPEQQYTLAVACTDERGNLLSPSTAKTTRYAMLDTPELTGAANTASGVRVVWEAVDGAANYRIFWKKKGGGWNAAGNTTATAFNVTGLTSGTTYLFTVRCTSADGRYYTSSYDRAGKTLTYLDAPRLNSVSVGNGGVALRWGKVSGAAKYRVFYRTGGGKWTKAADPTATSCTLTKLSRGKTYTFTVRCISADGTTFASGYDAVGKTVSYLATPKLTGLGFSGKGVKVSWEKVTGAARYRVYYKSGSSGWTLAGTTTSTSFVVSGLKNRARYVFTVRCVSDDNRQYTSGYDTVGKTLTYLAPPVLTNVTAGRNSAVIRWNKVKGAAKYRVFYRTDSSGWVAAGDTTSQTCTVSKLRTGVRYTFTVRCISANGRSYASGYDQTGLAATVK